MPHKTYVTSPQGGGSGPPPPAARKYFPGHYTLLSLTQTGSNAGGNFHGIINAGVVTKVGGHWQPVDGSNNSTAGTIARSDVGPVAVPTAALVIRVYYKDISNGDGTFNLDFIEKCLAQCATFNPPVPLFVTFQTRTFDGSAGLTGDGTDPIPAALKAATGLALSTWFNNPVGNNSGWQTWRWNAGFLNDFDKACQAIGNAFDSNPLFAGLATQETATGGVTDGGFGQASYQAGLKSENASISKWCPTSRHLAYQNFTGTSLTNATQTAMLLQYAIDIQPNGALFGGPDLTTAGGVPNGAIPGGLPSRAYINYPKMHNGTNGVPAPGLTFCSIQSAEFQGQAPGDNPANFYNLYNYGTSSNHYPNSGVSAGALQWSGASNALMNLDVFIWDYHTAGGSQNFWSPDALAIINNTSNFWMQNPNP